MMNKHNYPVISSFIMMFIAALIFCGRQVSTNLIFSITLGLFSAHLFVWQNSENKSIHWIVKKTFFIFFIFLIPVYGIITVGGGFLIIFTIFRLLEGSHFKEYYSTLLVSFSLIILGIIFHHDFTILIYLFLYFLAATEFLNKMEMESNSKYKRIESTKSRIYTLKLKKIFKLLLISVFIFVFIPRTSLNIYLIKGGVPGFSTDGVNLSDMENLRLQENVVMRVILSKKSNVYFRAKSFNIYSTRTKKWYCTPNFNKEITRVKNDLEIPY